jgi:hypothetical protein
MNMTLALVLSASMSARAAGLPNFDFSTGKLTNWEGEGFIVTPFGGGKAVTSANRLGKALIHRTFMLPTTATAIHFSAAVMLSDGIDSSDTIDIILEAAERTYLPRQVRLGKDWKAAPRLLPADNRRLREYRWPVESHAGRRVRIALYDSDERAGCHLIATGFHIVTRDEVNAQQFARDMQQLQKEHTLPRMLRYDSKHFMALSNAEPGYTEYRLYNCETIHALFFEHFRKRGFAVRAPAEKMMVAIFSTPQGLEAYLGQKMSEAVTGVYHTPSNRLVVYDYGKNRLFLEGKKSFEAAAREGSTDLERERRTLTFGRHVRDRRDDTNISTIMHEVAHQLAFNGGLLNRAGDNPVWLVEGMAVYCESTVRGAWQGIGEPNPMRARVLAQQLRAGGDLIPIRELVGSDDWIRKARYVDQVVLGYSQSWALYRLLMEERPKQLKAYLETIYPRKTPDHRLADFASAFGADLPKLERRYRAHVNEIVRKEAPADEPRRK